MTVVFDCTEAAFCSKTTTVLVRRVFAAEVGSFSRLENRFAAEILDTDFEKSQGALLHPREGGTALFEQVLVVR